jgi:hypothetical protein
MVIKITSPGPWMLKWREALGRSWWSADVSAWTGYGERRDRPITVMTVRRELAHRPTAIKLQSQSKNLKRRWGSTSPVAVGRAKS